MQVEPLDGLDDGLARLLALEVIDAQVVVEEVRDAPLEKIKLRDRVLAHRNEKTHAQVEPVDGRGKLDGERARAVVGGVIEKVLLELIEDDQQIAVDGVRPSAEAFLQRGARRILTNLAGDGVREARERVVAPRLKHDDCELRRAARGLAASRRRAELVHHAGIDDRALADAAWTIEERQSGGLQVGGDDLALRLAPEEELGLRLGERHQPGVRALSHGAPPRLTAAGADARGAPPRTAQGRG